MSFKGVPSVARPTRLGLLTPSLDLLGMLDEEPLHRGGLGFSIQRSKGT